TGSLTNTDQATFSTNSSISTILIDGTEEAGTPLNIGSIAFLDNNLATNYVIGDALGNPLVMTSNADEGSSARQIFISGALRSAAVAPITATIAAPVILAPQSPT